jgi:hypothetical protein
MRTQKQKRKVSDIGGTKMVDFETEPDVLECPFPNAPQQILSYRSMTSINAKPKRNVMNMKSGLSRSPLFKMYERNTIQKAMKFAAKQTLG